MKKKTLALFLLAGGSLFAHGHWSIGVSIGAPDPYYAPPPVYYAPPAPIVEYRTPCPGPNYVWTAGYWYPAGPRYTWHAGYWVRRPYPGAHWVGPGYMRGRYYRGYWRR